MDEAHVLKNRATAAWQFVNHLKKRFLLLLSATRVVRYPWGVWFGHVLQVVLLSTGFIEILAAVTAAIFVGFWIYCFVKGTQLDAATRAAA